MPAQPPAAINSDTLSSAVRTLCRRDADLRASVRRFGEPPLWLRSPGFATLVKIILEQQVSLSSAKHAYRRLQSAVGGRVGPIHVLALGETGLREAGITRQKARYCCGLARAVRDGEIDLSALAELTDEDVRERLETIPGIGRWTSNIFLLMSLGRPDVWPPGDVALAQAMAQVKRLKALPDAEKQVAIAAAWSPLRSVAARVLWHHYLCVRRLRSGSSGGLQ